MIQQADMLMGYSYGPLLPVRRQSDWARSASLSCSRTEGLSLALRMYCTTCGELGPKDGERLSRSLSRTGEASGSEAKAGSDLRAGVRGECIASGREEVDDLSKVLVMVVGSMRHSVGDSVLCGEKVSVSWKRSIRYRESSTQPPPTRTMTVRDRKIRQKHNFARDPVPIQYRPDLSVHSSGESLRAGNIGIGTCMVNFVCKRDSHQGCLGLGLLLHLICSSDSVCTRGRFSE